MAKNKPVHNDVSRSYRKTCKPGPGEVAFQVVVEQTDLWIIAEQDLSREIGDFVQKTRARLKTYIELHPEFLTSLSPVDIAPGAPKIAQDMVRAAKVCNVGPMAGVAGAMAQAAAEEFAEKSPNILVENGGDIYIFSSRPRTVGLLPDPKRDMNLGLKLNVSDFPVALCASSGRIGHSLSLGQGDLVVVRAQNAALADCAATALANMLKNKKDVNAVLALTKELAKDGLQGVFTQFDDRLGIWGEMELTAI